MQLHTETTGQGPDLFLLHGWGLHSGVWDAVVPELAADWRVTRVALPGHGHSRGVPLPARLEDTARLVIQVAPPSSVWLGWSFGGLVALRAALDFRAVVRALVLVSSAPRFVTGPDWPYAMTPERIAEFALDLQRDYEGTVHNFLGLQLLGAPGARNSLRRLCTRIVAAGEPDAASLGVGVEMLRHSDLRAEVGRLDLPVLIMSGGRDRLVPPAAGRALAAMIKGAQWMHFPHAAHAPFLSQPRDFVAALRAFLGELPARAAATQVNEVSTDG